MIKTTGGYEMRKLLSLFLLMILTTSLLSIQSHADMGPKATADILIVGVDDNFYFDVLIERTNEVEVLSELELSEMIEYNYYQTDYPAHVLNGYQDEDGFASRTLYSGAPGTISKFDAEIDEFHLGYFHAPEIFKVVIILEDDTMIVSEIIERKLFNSQMTYDLTGVDLSTDQFGVGVLEEDIPYNDFTLSLILRVIITIAVEILILWMFKFRHAKSYKLVGFMNFVTQTLLSLGMVLGYYFWGSIFGLAAVLVIGEFFVFVSEIAIYSIFLKEKGHGKAILYGFVANLVTLILTIFTIPLI